MRLELDEVRRLTGPNLLWDEPGAILDVFISGTDKLAVIQTWQQWMDKLLLAFGWQQTHTYRLYSGGASMALSAPMDALYVACDLAELAWDCCVAEFDQQPLPDWRNRLDELRIELNDELNPRLITLLGLAKQKGVSAISDDDEFSLGMGASAEIWPIRALPDPQQLDWSRYSDIPRAFITGTNGKSTSVRLASEIAKAANFCAGVTSTDFIKVGDEIIDEGDYSGPGGARMLLRDSRTEMAFLEVARGGILRRGLPIEKVDAALITNVASDHLGQYGINTVAELAQVKFVVTKGLADTGVLVTNADNPWTVEQAKYVNCEICWFSESASNPLIMKNLSEGKPVVYADNGKVIYVDNIGQKTTATAIKDIPMTIAGAAHHNVQNALGVVGLCMALKLPLTAIRSGLHSFGSDAQDNPGRGNLYHYHGATVMVDFAHNAHSVAAMINTAKQMPAKRYIVMFSNAGDRSDSEIRNLTQAVADLNADMYLVAEIEKYLRGRKPFELVEIATQALIAAGIESEKIVTQDSPVKGAKLAKQIAKDGDVILLFTLDQRDKVHQLFSDTDSLE
ncbi:Mur ligase family protein [Aliiglaciecola litoralis]|uniref:Mur ligase family protein n=1 Tax=Aliiglaciecola litoralis TaxID=582857 RepID=A0ABN1LG52_9ALTE